jgi:hypothetical protein
LLIAVVICGPAILTNVDLGDIFGQGTERRPLPSPDDREPASRGTAKRTGVVMVAMPPCTNGRRAPPRGSCIIDGNSGWLNGRQWRLKGIDAAEIGKPECAAEREMG